MFTFVLNTCGGLELILKPVNAFDNIKIRSNHYNYRRLFKQAINEMKKYNRGL